MAASFLVFKENTPKSKAAESLKDMRFLQVSDEFIAKTRISNERMPKQKVQGEQLHFKLLAPETPVVLETSVCKEREKNE